MPFLLQDVANPLCSPTVCVYLEKEEKAILVLAAKETKLLSELMKYWYLMSSTPN